jgi:sulfate transport system substrate-binding protein
LLSVLFFYWGDVRGEKPVKSFDTLVLGAYTVPKEAYEKEIIPAFQDYWKKKTGREVRIEQSYVGSGAQARAIVEGFEADVAALSLEGDIDQIVKAKLISHDWKNRAWKGFITHSVVVIGFRQGNPKKIQDWEDLTRQGVEVLYPNPKTSGGAQWNVNAIYGGGLKISQAKSGKPDAAYARDLLKRVQKRVKVMDKSGRESVTTFERGIGDALVTYENEVLLRQMVGKSLPFVIPPATILIQNPVAVVDRYVDKHGVRVLAEEFVKFLHTNGAQRSFAKFGFRPANPAIGKEFQGKYPTPALLFDIDYLGGWGKVLESIYGPKGIWTQITQELAREK